MVLWPGLPTTIAPTALALGVAVVVVVLSRVRLGGRTTPSVVVPAADAPMAMTPTPVSFDIDYHLGTFHLALTHRANGRHLAILGPSGSGKSALLRCPARPDAPCA